MLADTPAAYVESLASAQAQTEGQWRSRAAAMTAPGSVTFVAEDGSRTNVFCGLMRVVVKHPQEPNRPRQAMLISVYVAVPYREAASPTRCSAGRSRPQQVSWSADCCSSASTKTIPVPWLSTRATASVTRGGGKPMRSIPGRRRSSWSGSCTRARRPPSDTIGESQRCAASAGGTEVLDLTTKFVGNSVSVAPPSAASSRPASRSRTARAPCPRAS